MAWLHHNGKQYYVAYRQGASRKVRYVPAGPNKRKALKIKDEVAHRARLGRIGGTVIPEPITFADHLRDWLSWRKVRPTTAKRDQGVTNKYLIPKLGDRLIGELRPRDFAQLAAGLTLHTARRTLAVASAALKDAVDNELISRNPVRLPPIPDKPYEEISVNVLCSVIAAMPERWRPFTFFLLLTGLRFAEAIAVTWGDVDFDANKIYVRRQKPSHLYGEEGRDPQALKTEAGHRAVDMLPPVRRMLLDLPQYAGTGLVFLALNGGYINYSHYHKAWRAVMRTLKVQGVKIHTLRHAFGSLLLVWGEDVMYATAQLGHESRTFTMETYAHQIKEGRRLDKDATLAKLEAAFRSNLAYTWLTAASPNLEKVVETMGFEPTTSAMRVRRSPN